MTAIYLLVGLVATALLFLWFEADFVQCPLNKYLPDSPDVHPYAFLLVWITWIVSVPALILIAAHMLHLQHHGAKKHEPRNK